MDDAAPALAMRERLAVDLAGPGDLDGFRHAVRRLVAAGVRPEDVEWRVADDAAAAPGAAPGAARDAAPDAAPGAASRRRDDADPAAALRLPAALVDAIALVILHADEDRYLLLHALIDRMQRDPRLRGDPLDGQWLRVERMAREVRRDKHKMKAYVRFRPVHREGDAEPLQVAWFEPEHHIVDAVAPFFAARFGRTRWSVLTPRRCVAWDGRAMSFAPGASRADAPAADAGEALWLAYYEHTFNPARLNLAMMRKEMPRRYWHNLPESVLIQPLAARAHERSMTMIQKSPTEPSRKARPAAKAANAPAGAATPLDALREQAARCTRCPLYRDATQTVFGEGPADAALMFVGEQPGDQEDLQGRPFVGPAGQLFDRALSKLGIDRERVYVTNAVKHFKFELRGQRRIHKTPAQREAAACLDWLEHEIDSLQPRVIVALGATAARSLLGRDVAVTRERGQWLERPDGRRVLVTLHPSALLRTPPEAREEAHAAWLRDLGKLADAG